MIENVAPCRRKLRVEIGAVRVAGVRAEILQEFRRHAEIPGFRPGHAPEPMIEKRFAHAIDDELRKRLIPDSYREAVVTHKLHTIGYPKIESVEYNPGGALVYTAAVDTAPGFKLPEYKGLVVTKKEIAVTDDEVAKALDALRDQQADFVDVPGRGLRTGDFAVLNYSSVADGKPIAELAPEAKTLGENQNFWLLVQPESFLPGFCDQLTGAQVGEKRQVFVDFPTDFPQKALVGRKATYFVDVVGIKQKQLPELNEDFAKRVGVESLEKLKQEIRKGLEAERDAAVRSDLRKQIVDRLLGTSDFELPESLVAQETRSIIYDLVRENSLRGVSKETLEQKKDEIFGFAMQSAKDRLRTSFILNAIAEAEGIKAEEREVRERVAQLAQRYRITPERLHAQLEERGGLGEIEEQIVVSKTLDFLLANARVETAKEA